jgi:hypothetical protein
MSDEVLTDDAADKAEINTILDARFSREHTVDRLMAISRKREDIAERRAALRARQAEPDIISCGRARRSEHHAAHFWDVGNDHNPGTERVICLGYPQTQENDHE